MTPSDLLTVGSGSIVGLVLGLVGGGGSILAVPLLVYVVGIASTHAAIGTSAIAVAASAAANLLPHWRLGHVKWRCAGVFSGAGVVGAVAGSSVAQTVDGGQLLLLFGLLMLVVGAMMAFGRTDGGDAEVHLTAESAGRLLPRLIGIGFAVGALAGFFGIGGGFLIVPGLMLATGMPLTHAIGTSLVAVTTFGAATAGNYALNGYVDWRIAALFVLGGVIGGLIGVGIGRLLARSKNALRLVFSVTVVAVGGWIVWQGLAG